MWNRVARKRTTIKAKSKKKTVEASFLRRLSTEK